MCSQKPFREQMLGHFYTNVKHRRKCIGEILSNILTFEHRHAISTSKVRHSPASALAVKRQEKKESGKRTSVKKRDIDACKKYDLKNQMKFYNKGLTGGVFRFDKNPKQNSESKGLAIFLFFGFAGPLTGFINSISIMYT